MQTLLSMLVITIVGSMLLVTLLEMLLLPWLPTIDRDFPTFGRINEYA